MRKIAAITLGVALALVGTAALAARNSSGVYSLPSGNPVVSGTVITKTWANATLGDLASEVSSSLDRSGRGGMLAPLRVPDGSAPAPTLSFTNETGTGLRRAGAGDLRIGVLGADTLKVTASGADVVRGDLTLPAAATQSVLKSGGVLAVGTSDDQEVQLVRNGVIGMALHAGAEPWFGGHRLTNIGTPTATDDAATKGYVDGSAPTALTLVGGFTGSPTYWKDVFGIVHLFGTITQGGAGGLVKFASLPAGYMPTAERRFPVVTLTGVITYVRIQPTTGDMSVNTLGGGEVDCLDGITFKP
jgi:hypothetical protein